jgi:hypothetical protein
MRTERKAANALLVKKSKVVRRFGTLPVLRREKRKSDFGAGKLRTV